MKGGVRKGAGRPALAQKKRAISVFLPPDLIVWMDKNKSLGSRAVIIETAVREKYSLNPGAALYEQKT